MAEITIPGMFLTGDHASRPAATAVGSGTLYACDDHKLIYQSDGASWSTWFDPDAAGSASTGMIPFAAPQGWVFSSVSTDATASLGRAIPILIPGEMRLRAAAFRVTIAGSGTHEWGLFDYSSNAAACSKLAGGSGALNSTGWLEIAASGAPVSISPGNYMFVFKNPAANVATQSTIVSGAVNKGGKSQASYVWDDTPDLTSGWSDAIGILTFYLRGDLNASSQW